MMFSCALSPIVRVIFLVPLAFLDIVGLLTLTVAVDIHIRLFIAPAPCEESPVLLPLVSPGFPGVALLVP